MKMSSILRSTLLLFVHKHCLCFLSEPLNHPLPPQGSLRREITEDPAGLPAHTVSNGEYDEPAARAQEVNQHGQHEEHEDDGHEQDENHEHDGPEHSLPGHEHDGHENEHALKHGHHKEAAPHDAHDAHAGHHKAHHDPHGDGGQSHEHGAMSTESFAISCLLLGVVGALMFVFYLVHSPYMGVKLATWRVLSMTASIFTAVLLYSTLKMLILNVFEPSFTANVAIILILFFIFYVGTHGVLFLLKDECTKSKAALENLEAAGTILAHMSGFAAMYGFADCFEFELVEGNGAGGLALLIVAASIFIVALSSVMERVMQKVAMDDGNTDDEKAWIEQCVETDDDVFCLAISFLVVLFLCFLILGRVMPYEPGKMGTITQSQANALLGCGIGFVLLICVGKFAKSSHRIKDFVLHMINMMMAWSFLFWTEWQLYVWGWESTVIGGALIVAFFLTIASFFVVIMLDVYSRRSQAVWQARGESRQSNKDVKKTVRSLELALGVLVGFSWERAFDVGFEEIEHAIEHNPKLNIGMPHWAGVAIMSVVLLILVAPAWRLYILPKAERLEELEKREVEQEKRKQVA